MGNLAFPQLSSGALVEFPLRKHRIRRAAANSYADGSSTISNLNVNSQRLWELAYVELTAVEQSALKDHFSASRGALLPFVFIDPTDNMVSSSTNLAAQAWQRDPLLSVVEGAADPFGGQTAFTVVNSSQIDRQLTQLILAPVNYHYCLSIYASASSQSSFQLGWGAQTQQVETFALASGWKRLINSGRLSEDGTTFTLTITVPAAQTVVIWGPQLEPQPHSSRYRPTDGAGGIYQNAHYVGDAITWESDAPGLFSTVINIETT